MAILSPYRGNFLGNASCSCALVELFGSKFERRDLVNISGNSDSFAGLGVGDGNPSLVFFVRVVEGDVDTKVDGAADEELVEA
jgi:hypothetical protein